MIEPWADAPLTDPTVDKLDRLPFVDMVARLIENLANSNDSTVLGLVGAWGSGKTTVLHYVTQQLNKSIKVVRFNPWSFDDDAGLQAELYSAMLEAFPLGSHENIRTKALDVVRRGTPLLKAIPYVGTAASETLKAFLPSKSWDSAFEDFSTAISEAGVKILVVVDDVDRLQPKELLLLMKTVRLLGRLPRVNYLLAYDKKSTVNTLSAALGPKARVAEDYLEKIVQYPLHLPAPQQHFLRDIVFAELGSLLQDPSPGDAGRGQTVRERFEAFYLDHMWTQLSTPRACRRYSVQAKTFLPLAGGDVDPADFFALTFLRLFFESLYNMLPVWADELTGNARPLSNQTPREEWVKRIERCGFDEYLADELVDTLAALFPNAVPSAHTTQTGAGLFRVSDREYFDRYFTFSLPDQDVSDVLVKKDLQRILEGKIPYGAQCPATFDHPEENLQMLALRKGTRHTDFNADTRHLIHFLSFSLAKEPLSYLGRRDSTRLRTIWMAQLIDGQKTWPQEEIDQFVGRFTTPAALGNALSRAHEYFRNAERRSGRGASDEETAFEPGSLASGIAQAWAKEASKWLVGEWRKDEPDVTDSEIFDVWNSVDSFGGSRDLQEVVLHELNSGGMTLPFLAAGFVRPRRFAQDSRAAPHEHMLDMIKLSSTVPDELLLTLPLGDVVSSGVPTGEYLDREARTRLAIQELRTVRLKTAGQQNTNEAGPEAP